MSNHRLSTHRCSVWNSELNEQSPSQSCPTGINSPLPAGDQDRTDRDESRDATSVILSTDRELHGAKRSHNEGRSAKLTNEWQGYVQMFKRSYDEWARNGAVVVTRKPAERHCGFDNCVRPGFMSTGRTPGEDRFSCQSLPNPFLRRRRANSRVFVPIAGLRVPGGTVFSLSVPLDAAESAFAAFPCGASLAVLRIHQSTQQLLWPRG